MISTRSLYLLTFCFCTLVSVFPLNSGTSASTSLWGEKVQFNDPPCMWQLHPEVVVPALNELSVCVLLRGSSLAQWTGFVYKAPGKNHIELGLAATSERLTVWLFGQFWQLPKVLKLNEWHSICLTWSSKARRLRFYINEKIKLDVNVDPGLPQQLAHNGTLTLGQSHYVGADGNVWPEYGNNLQGEIGLFRMWGKEWSPMEVRRLGCADGDVLSWDLRQWKHDCPLTPDDSLHCEWSRYKIKTSVFVAESLNPGNCLVSPEEITRNWLESMLPGSISILDIFVSLPNQTCHMVNTSAGPHVKQPQAMEELSNSICGKCFSCEVDVSVDPAANVKVVQDNVTALLNSTFSYNSLTLTVDLNSLTVFPAVAFPVLPEPLSSTSTALTTPLTSFVGPDVFFRVNVTLSMIGNPTKPEEVIKRWVKQQLESNGVMSVLNLIIKEQVNRNMKQYIEDLMIVHSQQKQYICNFHVQTSKQNNVTEIKSLIDAALASKYENGSITIQTKMVATEQIVPGNCLEELTSTSYGSYIWPETFPLFIEEMGCEKPRSERAYRQCKLNIETDRASWANPDMTNCEVLVTISDIGNITVTPDNGAEVVGIIQDIVNVQLGNGSQLSSSQLVSVVEKLWEVVDISIIDSASGADIVSIVADILLSETDVTPVSNTVLDLTEKLGNSMEFQGELTSITAPALALSMVNVDRDEYDGLTFGVSMSSEMNPEVHVNQSFESGPLPQTDATISLPSELNTFFPTGVRNRVQFHFYATQDLFQDPGIANATHSSWSLNSYVISASINNSVVMNLGDPVVVTLNHHNPKQPEDKVQCMFWDFKRNGGLGGWNGSGCETRSISSHQTICLCDHLTHFAVLLDVSRAPIPEAHGHALTILSYVGCGISSLFLGFTLVTYLVFGKLRRDNSAKILINLSAALLGLSLLFLLDSWLSSFSNYGLCIATAVALHYFLLASFTWMGLEAVQLYFMVVKVFNTYVPMYMLKLCAVGWGIPLVIVSLVLAIDKDAYGSSPTEKATVSLQSTEHFCWLQNDISFYVTVVGFILLVLVFNASMFVVVLIQIKKTSTNKKSTKRSSTLRELRAALSLTVLLGLTWSMGFFSFGPGRLVIMYLFTICNTLQGFFVFLFHCVMKENVRNQWRMSSCCGRFRLRESSAWSQSTTVTTRCKRSELDYSDSVASTNSSSLKSLTPHSKQHPNRPNRGQ
ncbi:adhesion G-protein coupled receptor G4 [Cololabis saira]|uniref:adhesion G-protein coupled receptor G4 n=1 Tax=Cololabis saira TaxID=129043 RepID=UPI002AD464BA|nr:adhesion G-protein coupled receptor G4 [Cololabis saira]XP_061581600.1 adhesion G-protein coupled receptor G4 [Cololabis saira]